jgi:adenine specific DNA methylase Mod
MAKIEVIKTELVWPGKYNDDGSLAEAPRVNLPFQVIETINESRAAREAKNALQPTLFEVWKGNEGDTYESGWTNKLIWGDNLLVMGSLLDRFAGKVDLIYIDPPFATGADFSFPAVIGESNLSTSKGPSLIEEKAYRDTWGRGISSYLQMISQRLSLIYELLSDQGSLFIHCDWHVNYLLRSILDGLFGRDRFLNEIIWYYYNKFQGNVNRFAADHDTIFWYRKGENFHFAAQKEKRPEGRVRQIQRAWDKEKGAIVNVKGPDGKVLYQETDEKTVDDVWRIPMLQPADLTENAGYPTQKPAALVERVLAAASSPGDLVADFFCGSGTTLVAAEKPFLPILE